MFLRLLDQALETCPQRLLVILSSWEPRGGNLSDGAGKEPGKRRARPPLSEPPVAPPPGPQLSPLALGTHLRATVASSASSTSSSNSGILIFPGWVLCREKGSSLAWKGRGLLLVEGRVGVALGPLAPAWASFERRGKKGKEARQGQGLAARGTAGGTGAGSVPSRA